MMSQNADIRGTVEKVIQQVLASSGRSAQSLQDQDLLFSKIGLDSLDLAQVVVILESELGVDPFWKSGEPIRTFGDLVQAYQSARQS
ncbi:MAG TPA: acyl carrier protein [Pirellulales bacterium]|jgi:acyl carrier protein|nr:acyl carrier protein [Pirellulales bacterium]